MLFLPELWENIDVDDLIYLLTRFTNIFSFFGLISFAYTFVEIDLIVLTFSLENVKENNKRKLLSYLENQYINFLKDETDIFFFEEGVLGVDNNQWMYIKQKLLLDSRIEPALKTPIELKKHIDDLAEKWGSI